MSGRPPTHATGATRRARTRARAASPSGGGGGGGRQAGNGAGVGAAAPVEDLRAYLAFHADRAARAGERVSAPGATIADILQAGAEVNESLGHVLYAAAAVSFVDGGPGANAAANALLTAADTAAQVASHVAAGDFEAAVQATARGWAAAAGRGGPGNPRNPPPQHDDA